MIIRSLFLTVVIAIVASANCLAMTFDKSTALGSIATFSPSGAFKIEGAASNQSTFAYDSTGNNWYGPRTIITQLPTTTKWSNVNLNSNTRAILGEYRDAHDVAITNGKTYPTSYSYVGYSARLLTVKEMMRGCGLTRVGNYTSGELDSCYYLMENTKYSKDSLASYGYWMETPHSNDLSLVWIVSGKNRYASHNYANYASGNGVRPTIDVSKSKIIY